MTSTSRTWISRFAVIAIALGSSLAMVAQDAEAARRFGGGKSFGRQSGNVNKQAAPANAAAAPTQTAPGAAPQQAQRNRWLGPLAGIAAGLGLAALFSHLGLSEGFGSILMILLLAMAAMFVWRMLRRGQPSVAQPRQEHVYAGASPQSSDFSAQAPLPGGASNSVMSSFAGAANWGIPADFDKEGFERSAKVHFIRLQAAWDAKELADIREFTTPEMYAEIKMQLSELKGEKTQTEVIDLEAEVLGVEASAREDLASVRLKGAIREAPNAAAEPFQEVWNLAKPKSGRSGWLLAGVQQIQ
ncbi:MAG: Tim44 domain-containing protein [Betaproteobacteria bacterium]|nr:Tim44 domain-containing protein [Betaproteobacteria bacterium]